MSELHFPRLATQSDYSAGFEFADQDFDSEGGIRAYLMKREYAASHGSMQSHRFVLSAGMAALNIEPVNEKGIVLDRTLGMTHAFKRGLLSAIFPLEYVQNQAVPFSPIYDSIAKSVKLHGTADTDGVDETHPLVQLGEKGLDFAGEEATKKAEEWAAEFYDDPVKRTIFTMGVGAVVLTYHAYEVNERISMIDGYFESFDWSKDLRNIDPSHTGEE